VNGCDAFRSDLFDVVLGATPHARLRAHLATCPSCAATLAEAQSTLAGIDSNVGESVAVEPLAGLTERIIGRLEQTSASRSFAGWGRIAAAAALAAGIAFATESFHDGGTIAAPSLAAWHSPTQSLLHSHESVIDTPLQLESGALPLTRS